MSDEELAAEKARLLRELAEEEKRASAAERRKGTRKGVKNVES